MIVGIVGTGFVQVLFERFPQDFVNVKVFPRLRVGFPCQHYREAEFVELTTVVAIVDKVIVTYSLPFSCSLAAICVLILVRT